MSEKKIRKQRYRFQFAWDIHLPIHKITFYKVSFGFLSVTLDVKGTQKQRIFLTLKYIEYSWNHKTKLQMLFTNYNKPYHVCLINHM